MEGADAGLAIGDLVGAAACLHTAARVGHARAVSPRLHDIVSAMQGELPQARAAHAAALETGDAEELATIAQQFQSLGATLLAAEAWADTAVAWRRVHNVRRSTRAQR